MKEKIISNKGLLFLVLLCSPLYAEVNITTLSDWDINDFDEHTLLVAKTSDTSQAWKSLLAFHVSRPHCVSTQPIIMVRSKHTTAMGVFDEVEIIPFKSVKTSFQTLCDIAGLKHVSIHTLRHGFCTQNIKRGTNIYTVKKFAGHQDIRTTMKYVNYLNDEDFTAFDNLEHNYMADPE